VTLRLNGSTSGYTEIDAPAVAGSNTITLPTGAGSAYQVVRNGATAGSLEFADKIVSGTAVTSTSGTSIDFTGIPSWVKRVTVMLNGVSTNGTSNYLLRVGTSSGVVSTGYTSTANYLSGGVGSGGATSTAGVIFQNAGSAASHTGTVIFTLINGNAWIAAGMIQVDSNITTIFTNANVTLSGTLDRVRITTVNGTDTFDAGSINILME
jgi:hypothetical protein